MSKLEDLVRDSRDLVLGETNRIAKGVGASQGAHQLRDDPQFRSADDIHKLLEQFEQSQREQAKETKKAFYVSLAALALNALAIIVAIAIALLG